MVKAKKGFWEGLYGAIWRLMAAVLVVVFVYVFLSNFTFAGTYSFNAEKGINLLIKNASWVVKQMGLLK